MGSRVIQPGQGLPAVCLNCLGCGTCRTHAWVRETGPPWRGSLCTRASTHKVLKSVIFQITGIFRFRELVCMSRIDSYILMIKYPNEVCELNCWLSKIRYGTRVI